MRIGVLADTHIPRRAKALPESVLQTLAGVDLILHAGDIFCRQVREQLAAIAPVEAVAGNGDPPEMVLTLGRQKLLHLAGFRLGLIHGDGRGRTTPERAILAFPGVDCVVFGHSHLPYNQRQGETLLFNPGSPTDRRRSPAPSCGLLHLTDAGVRGEIIYLALPGK